MFSLFRKKSFFSDEEQQRIVDAIQHAEQLTSGEVRLFVESRCSYVDPVDRAVELFFSLEMNKTQQRNGVLVYIATKDRQLAIFGDEGIHKSVGEEYWKKEVHKMLSNFNKHNYSEGLIEIIHDIGESLHKHFPYDRETDKNELPDDIVFGR